jgi:hypothetical protein
MYCLIASPGKGAGLEEGRGREHMLCAMGSAKMLIAIGTFIINPSSRISGKLHGPADFRAGAMCLAKQT